MMSPKRWVLLLIFYISYLMFGASIYYHIEHGLETQKRAEKLKARLEINEYLHDQLSDKNTTTKDEILGRLNDYCGEPVTDPTEAEEDLPYTWTFYHSFFFAFTVCSTVGYGNISPSTPLGRWIMIAYSVIGIPVNGILFAGLGEYFGKTFEAIYRRYKKYKLSRDIRYVPPQIGLVTTIAFALVPGITLFLLLPAWVFTYFEGWTYSLAVYYSYVTTTTIGFGDYVATFNKTGPRKFGHLFVVYELFVIVWFIFSLGYLLMIMTFITRGLQSKRLSRLEQQLSTNIKATHHRIWNGVTKDVGYLRRILNELYILKLKPVYTEPDPQLLLRRSNSCPELTMYRIDPPPTLHRKRAFSECYDPIEEATGTPIFVHASSDTDIDKIDKQKSFENAEAFRQTTGLLAKVVTALASIKPPADEQTTVGSAGIYGGYHGFSDSQILASEWSFPSVNDTLPPQPRGRACSDFNLTPKWKTRRQPSKANEWTWSGDNQQIQEAINNRFRQSNGTDRSRTIILTEPQSQEYIVQMDNDETRKPTRAKKFSIPDGLRRLFPFRKRLSQEILSENGPADRKLSIVSVPDSALQSRGLPMDYFNSETANGSLANIQNGKLKQSQESASATSIYYSDASKPDYSQDATAAPTSPYLRKNILPPAPTGLRKRRESLFTQNPAIANRRSSMFQSSGGAAGLTQRRGSLFNFDRRGSNSSVAIPMPDSRTAASDRRPSLFSVQSEQDLDVLESTTLGDLIRALEVMHTQAVLEDAVKVQPKRRRSEFGGIFDRGESPSSANKSGSTDLPPLLTLFAGKNEKALSATAANRLYARRSTIVGTLPSTSAPIIGAQSISAPSIANAHRRRRPSATPTPTIAEPPPTYDEQDEAAQLATIASNNATKFKRRFSVRPTALQIPPGKAPPPGGLLQQPMGSTLSVTSSPSSSSPSSSSSQTVLQRRLSLRPSPLARELATIPSESPSPSSETSGTPISSAGNTLTPSNAARLLPSRPSNTSSSTHSPLSRIVQIAQAQRKISMAEPPAKPENEK